ncbi:uncharacterized protein LOC131688170 [Topomyia yanbarensis]|uniref:uncharacterized protein LOC131688170 n=1 Tax=Topomyia yanbarensis TaxID=2498891 RepID=UPI00273B9EB8|nr:uncharacterized protein LOC131688170 [Topomyia yanbarensis]
MDSYKQFHLDPFNDAADASNLRLEWEEWHRACELVLELSNIDSQHQKLLFMLARGGRGLQRIYYNLAPVAGEIQPGPVKIPLAPKEIPEYDNAIKRLNAFFIGKRNERVELEVFRSLRQSAGESFNRYILKLRTQAARCDFRDRVENELLQQITVGASDERVRDKGLESIMNLDELVNYAVNREVLQKQKEKSYPFRPEAGVVASVKQDWITKSEPKSSNRGQPFAREKKRYNNIRTGTECDRCGSWKHHRDSRECIARNCTCNKCGSRGHFARKCRAGRYASTQPRYTWKKTDKVNTLQDESSHQASCYVENEPSAKVE